MRIPSKTESAGKFSVGKTERLSEVRPDIFRPGHP